MILLMLLISDISMTIINLPFNGKFIIAESTWFLFWLQYNNKWISWNFLPYQHRADSVSSVYLDGKANFLLAWLYHYFQLLFLTYVLTYVLLILLMF